MEKKNEPAKELENRNTNLTRPNKTTLSCDGIVLPKISGSSRTAPGPLTEPTKKRIKKWTYWGTTLQQTGVTCNEEGNQAIHDEPPNLGLIPARSNCNSLEQKWS